jgi:hypothetical protein
MKFYHKQIVKWKRYQENINKANKDIEVGYKEFDNNLEGNTCYFILHYIKIKLNK